MIDLRVVTAVQGLTGAVKISLRVKRFVSVNSSFEYWKLAYTDELFEVTS